MIDNKAKVMRVAKSLKEQGCNTAHITRLLNNQFKSIFYSEQSGDKILICAEGLTTRNKFVVLKIRKKDND